MNTWEPTAHVPADLIKDFQESRIGLEEETDNDDSCAEESEAEGEAESKPAAKRPAASRATKPASTSGRGKRAAPSAGADSSDEEDAPLLPLLPALPRSRRLAAGSAQPLQWPIVATMRSVSPHRRSGRSRRLYPLNRTPSPRPSPGPSLSADG